MTPLERAAALRALRAAVSGPKYCEVCGEQLPATRHRCCEKRACRREWERRARVRRDFIENLAESRLVMNTKIDGFVAMTHLWAGEAVYHNQPLQLMYISSMQAIEPGIAVPGYVVANWAVLKLPEVLKVNLGKASNMVSAACLMLPFVRTGMTEEYADNPKVFGRWQPRMLEPFEAAGSVAQLLSRPADELNLGNYKLCVAGSAAETKLYWSQVRLEVKDDALPWSEAAPLVYPQG